MIEGCFPRNVRKLYMLSIAGLRNYEFGASLLSRRLRTQHMRSCWSYVSSSSSSSNSSRGWLLLFPYQRVFITAN